MVKKRVGLFWFYMRTKCKKVKFDSFTEVVQFINEQKRKE